MNNTTSGQTNGLASTANGQTNSTRRQTNGQTVLRVDRRVLRVDKGVVRVVKIVLRRGVVVVNAANRHPAKSQFRFCAGSNPAHGVSEIRDGEEF